MAHFARINNNVVDSVVVIHNSILLDSNGVEQESLGLDFCRSLYGDTGEWLQTSYSGSIRKNFASPGFTYDSARDAFIAPKPYASWVLNETTCVWEPPVPQPDNDAFYQWDETTTSWLEIDLNEILTS